MTSIQITNIAQLFNSAAMFLLVNGILIVQPTHNAAQKHLGAIVHGILNGVALACFLTAFSIIVYNKSLHTRTHYYLLHK
jgi:hypothetical protein